MIGPKLAARGAALFVLLLAVTAGASVLSNRPLYHPIPPGSGVVTLTFTHSAERRAACRRFTPEEIARMPPNMRRTADCPRGRLPVLVELDLDGRTLLRDTLAPTGLSGDGPSHVYRRFVLPAGEYDIAVRLRDTPRAEGFDRERRERVALAPERNLVIDFRPDTGFVFR
jgi:hypothetical protein